MELRVLAVGDVVGDGGLQCLEKHLRSLKKLYRADFCVVNGENASGTGLTPRQADRMLDAGADVITLGNHSFDRREICTYLLRPGNLRPSLSGRGWGVFETKIGPVGVMNLLGRCNLDFRPDNPFLIADKILQELGEVPVFLDFHAEATSEKLALAYQTDLGMTGPVRSVIGVRPEQSIANFRGELTSRYEVAPGPCMLTGAVFTYDAAAKRCTGAERVRILD